MGPTCTLRPTAAAGEARALAREAVARGFDVVVAAGGDGTLNEVINGIGDEPGGFARARCAVLPLGTANCAAREFGMPHAYDAAWQIILRGKSRTIDLPLAEYRHSGRIERRYFAQMAGAGLDARAIELVHPKLKRVSGYLAHVIAGLQAVTERKALITMTGAGKAVCGEQVVVSNGRFYGGPFTLFPQADPADGQLDCCVLRRATWGAVTALAWGLVTGQLHRAAGMTQSQAQTLSLTSPAHVSLELDGELVGTLPATFSVQRGVVQMIVP